MAFLLASREKVKNCSSSACGEGSNANSSPACEGGQEGVVQKKRNRVPSEEARSNTERASAGRLLFPNGDFQSPALQDAWRECAHETGHSPAWHEQDFASPARSPLRDSRYGSVS
jgi:hypothetical protein